MGIRKRQILIFSVARITRTFTTSIASETANIILISSCNSCIFRYKKINRYRIRKLQDTAIAKSTITDKPTHIDIMSISARRDGAIFNLYSFYNDIIDEQIRWMRSSRRSLGFSFRFTEQASHGRAAQHGHKFY